MNNYTNKMTNRKKKKKKKKKKFNDNNDDNNNGNRDNYFRTVTRSAPSAIIDEHRWEPFETPLATEECNKAMRKKNLFFK